MGTPLLLLELILAFAILVGAAEALVHGASALATRLGISSLVVGLTVVALGTSFPELFVSVIASARGEPSVALGNVIGSNIFNLSVILGISAIIRPVKIEMRLLRLEIPFVFLISIMFLALAANGVIGRLDATVLLTTFVAYLWYVRRSAFEDPTPLHTPATGIPITDPDQAEARSDQPSSGTPWRAILLTAGALVALGFGAAWIVDTATELAARWGVSDRMIGLTLIAGGTSLPELAAVLVAVTRKKGDLAVGSLLGSNIFNTLAITGTAAMVGPLGPTEQFMGLDILAMLAAAALLIPLASSGWRLNRLEGVLLVSVYATYMTLLLTGGGGA